jgi:hypothetical protein
MRACAAAANDGSAADLFFSSGLCVTPALFGWTSTSRFTRLRIHQTMPMCVNTHTHTRAKNQATYRASPRNPRRRHILISCSTSGASGLRVAGVTQRAVLVKIFRGGIAATVPWRDYFPVGRVRRERENVGSLTHTHTHTHTHTKRKTFFASSTFFFSVSLGRWFRRGSVGLGVCCPSTRCADRDDVEQFARTRARFIVSRLHGRSVGADATDDAATERRRPSTPADRRASDPVAL